jgi:eukaryotic-like serine/threonine-protein kinase
MLMAGTRLGPYEILGAIGAGGMGEVYRARDTRLGRDVAIKILPQHLTEKADARQRFEREARAVSSLNHPHICTLYDIGQQDGTDFLVMELLEGETLAKRLEKGPLATAELLRIAIEIADALEKAHRQGILHRDLKPSNIMLTKVDAKLMDFGLAKASDTAGAPMLSSLTQSLNPSAKTTPVTAEGTIVGTFQYMAPEQMEGKEADARSDVFSFGAMLFEMATGKRAFEGKTTASVIAAILEREPPPISSVQPMSPPALDRTVKICLAKDPDERFQSAHDVKLQLEWIRDAGSQAGVAAPIVARRKLHERFWIGATALVTIIAALFATGYFLRAPTPASAIMSQIEPPEKTEFVFSGTGFAPPTPSPDGQLMVFSATSSDGQDMLWLRALNAATARPLEGTDGATFPFWSPDGQSLAFFANNKLNRIDVAGGPPLPLCESTLGRGGTWAHDGTILFTPNTTSPLMRISASGGTPQPITKLRPSERSHRWPQFLPDERHFLYFVQSNVLESAGVFAASLDGGEPKLILRNNSAAFYAPPGYLLFVRDGTLMAQHFNADKLTLIGDAAPLATRVGANLAVNLPLFAASKNGILAYQSGGAVGGSYRLLWFDRTGKQIAETGTPDVYFEPRISPDDRRLVVSELGPVGGGTANLWVFDLVRGIKTRLTFSGANDREPAWSADGKTIAYVSSPNTYMQIFQNPADGTGTSTPLVAEKDATEYVPSFSTDGRYVIYQRLALDSNSHREIWAMPLAGERKPFPAVQIHSDVFEASLSPNGKWLAYTSAESGTFDIYVVPFQHGGGRWEVSTNGGTGPKWRGDGKELFYLSQDNKIMSAEISEAGSSLVIGKVQSLFQVNPFRTTFRPYDASSDGKKFVVVSMGATEVSEPLTLVVNWPALLKKQ